MKLLIVEDNPANIEQYGQIIDDANSAGGERVEHVVKNTLPDAIDVIEKEHFDAAIVDLRLSGTEDLDEGNAIIRHIVNGKRLPVFVYSSFLGDVDPAIQESIFFQKFDRTAITFAEVLEKLLNIYKTGVTKILGRGGVIENHLTKIFWKHVAESFEELSRRGISEDQLLRYIAGHLYEYLELNEATGTFDKYLPEEVYIKPSIKPQFFTGSIIKERASDKLFIILTPACDIAQQKAKRILVAEMSSLTEDPVRQLKTEFERVIPVELNGEERIAEEDKKKTAEIKLNNIFGNNYSHRYYFLPNSTSFQGGLINFQNLESMEPGTMEARFEIVATVNAGFLKDIVSKFAFYYSRQGAPDLSFSIGDLP